jgi:hypothetical protein
VTPLDRDEVAQVLELGALPPAPPTEVDDDFSPLSRAALPAPFVEHPFEAVPAADTPRPRSMTSRSALDIRANGEPNTSRIIPGTEQRAS